MSGNPSQQWLQNKAIALLQSLLDVWIFCMIIILICSFRLFIEKLPKHRDYKSAVIPEKKDTVKVGLRFHCCPSKSFKAAQTHSKVKVVVSASEHQILQWEIRPFHQISYEVAGIVQ